MYDILNIIKYHINHISVLILVLVLLLSCVYFKFLAVENHVMKFFEKVYERMVKVYFGLSNFHMRFLINQNLLKAF